MPRLLRTIAPLPTIDGVLVKRRDFSNARRHHDLIDEAQRRACAIVRRADAQSDAIRQYAAARGFREGLHAAWSSVTPWLQAFDRHCEVALESFAVQIRSELDAAFREPAVVEYVMRQVFDDTTRWRARRIRICVPKLAAGLAREMERWAREAGVNDMQVVSGDDDRLSIECADAVYVFDIPALAHAFATRLDPPASIHGEAARAYDAHLAARIALASIDTARMHGQQAAAFAHTATTIAPPSAACADHTRSNTTG